MSQGKMSDGMSDETSDEAMSDEKKIEVAGPELVMVLETNQITEALLAQGLLESEGITVDSVSFGVSELTATMMGARLLVSSEQAEKARAILAARQPLAEDFDVGVVEDRGENGTSA